MEICKFLKHHDFNSKGRKFLKSTDLVCNFVHLKGGFEAFLLFLRLLAFMAIILRNKCHVLTINVFL